MNFKKSFSILEYAKNWIVLFKIGRTFTYQLFKLAQMSVKMGKCFYYGART